MNNATTLNPKSPRVPDIGLGVTRRLKRVCLSALVILALLLMWRDSTINRSAASVYTRGGVITAIHHDGRIDVVWSNVAIPWPDEAACHLWSERSRNPVAQSLSLPSYSRTGEHIISGQLNLPYWLILTITLGNVGGFCLIAETLFSNRLSHRWLAGNNP